MKLKTSFFDFTVLKKDISRFFPVWAIYLIGGLLISQTSISWNYSYSAARNLISALPSMILINGGYAAVIALLLFGDLFKGRMCNALHALPVRRESWFVTHSAAAVLMSLIPNLILAALMLPSLGEFWFTAFLWVLMMTMEFVFFFGVSAFCIQCVGNGLAVMLMYAICNFGAFLIMWVVQIFAIPMLYGVTLNPEPFYLFSPVVYYLSDGVNFWSVEHLSSCKCHYTTHYYSQPHDYAFAGLGDSWGYLTVLTVLGVGFLVAALLLYRRRKLESAGDFAAIKPAGWVFTIVGSVLAGMVFHMFGMDAAIFSYPLLFAGMLVGFFLCRMLLERRVKVFSKKNWLRLVALWVGFGIFLGLAAVDVLGIERRIPDAEQVKSVTISESYLSNYRLNQITKEETAARGIDPSYGYNKDGVMTLRNEAQIREITQIHAMLLEEGDCRDTGFSYQVVTLHYVLKDGSTLTRYYYPSLSSDALARLQQFTSTPEYILGAADLQELRDYLTQIYLWGEADGSFEIKDPKWLDKFCEAIFADAKNGNLSRDAYDQMYTHELELEYIYADGVHRYLHLAVTKSASQTYNCIQDYIQWFRAGNK